MESSNLKDCSDEQNPKMQVRRLFQTGFALLHGKKKSIDKAIKCFQRAVALDNSNYIHWQFLGEAYYQRGSLTPAISCFEKSISLIESNVDKQTKSDMMYCQMRIAEIRMTTGQYDAALEGYEKIILNDEKNFGALYGLAKAELHVAQNDFYNGLVNSGHEHCYKALDYSFKCISLRSHLCLTWKLASDCCLVLHAYGKIGGYSNTINLKDGSKISIDRSNIVDIAIDLICKALNNENYESSPCLFHNLGIALYYKGNLATDDKSRKDSYTMSMKSLLKAMSYDRQNSMILNSLGAVCLKLNYIKLSQSFFINSIRNNMSTSERQFTNLGLLHMHTNNFHLAAFCFHRAQSEEPFYIKSWLGDAFLSRHMGQDFFSSIQHANSIGFHYDSQLLFCDTVVRLGLDKVTKQDVEAAADSIDKVVKYEKSSQIALNLFDIISEMKENVRKLEAKDEDSVKKNAELDEESKSDV